MNNRKIIKHFGSSPIIWAPLWGISKLRKRGGNFAGSINGAAMWYDQWYDRTMSRKGAETLVELDINLVILPFSLGGSHRLELSEREDFSRMAEIFHELGVKVLPYLQYQNFLSEEHTPDSSDWAVRADGTRQQYAHWRRTVCQSSEAFKTYFKELFTDAITRGADGIWLDNNYLHPCYCEKCQNDFRDYLRVNYSHLLKEFDWLNFDLVEIPPYLEATRDLITQAYLEFNCERNLKVHRELKAHLEQLSPDAMFGGNPALYRGNSYSHRGIDFKQLIELHDLMYLENKFFPQIKNNQISGNYHGFIACSELNTAAIPGAWKLADFDSITGREHHGMPENLSEIERVMLEAVAFDGIPGALWSVRTRPRETCKNSDDLMKLYCEHPEINHAMKTVAKTIQQLQPCDYSENAAEIAVLQHRESLMFDFAHHCSGVQAAEELLLRAGLPYEIAFSENLKQACDKHKLLILPHVNLLSDSETSILRNYVENGGRILVIGDAGLFNERYRERIDFALADVLKISSFDTPQEVTVNQYHKGVAAFYPSRHNATSFINMMSAGPEYQRPDWTDDIRELGQLIKQLLGEELQIATQPPTGCSIFRNEDGLMIQLFSHEDSPEPQSLQLSLREDLASASIRYISAIGTKTLSTKRQNGRTIVEIPNFSRYARLTI